jgi:pyruvate formate lyase activating enzyme
VPIVPEHTALASNLEQIAAHLEGPFEEVHLLPYHRWGESKRDLIDSPQPTLEIDPPGEEEMRAIGKIFEERGILVRAGG